MEDNNLQQHMETNPYAPQQGMQGPSWDGFVAPHLAGKNKKSKKGLVIGIITAAAFMVTAIAGFAVYKLVFDTPRARLAKGFANLAEEMGAYRGWLADKLDYAALTERYYTEPYSVEMRMNITNPNLESTIDTVGFDISEHMDYPGRKLDAGFSISLWNAPLFSGSVTVDDDTLYVSLPTFVKDTYSFNLDSLGKDFNRSAWSRLLNMHAEENLSLDVFAKTEDTQSSDMLSEEYREIILNDWKELVKSAVIEDGITPIEIERDGKTIRCSGIKVVLKKEALNLLLEDVKDGFLDSPYMEEMIERLLADNDLLLEGSEDADNDLILEGSEDAEKEIRENLEEWFSLAVEEDFEIYFHLDSKNRIVGISMWDQAAVESEWLDAFGFSFVFSGTKHTPDEISGSLELVSEGETMAFSIERSVWADEVFFENEVNVMLDFEDDVNYPAIMFKYESEWDWEEDEFRYLIGVSDGDNEFALKMKGAFTDIVKGERFTLNIGQLSFLADDEEMLKVAGTYSMEPFSGEIKTPESAIELFRMTEMEIGRFVIEVDESINKFRTEFRN